MKRLLISVVGMIGLLAPTTAHAAAESFTASVNFPISVTAFVPCANGGAGEAVTVSGMLHNTFHVTFDSHGGATVIDTSNPHNAAGVGETTGTRYRGVGHTTESFHVGVGLTDTFTNAFMIVAQVGAPSLRVIETIHLTVNAKGTLTADVFRSRITCR